MNRRGITLTEVLVAIFVTGMGLMALMTLFPLGAVNMSLAIKDDRASHAAANATALLRSAWRQGLDSGSPDPSFKVLANGKPVYIDPIGNLTYAGSGRNWVAGFTIQRLPLHLAVPSGNSWVWGQMPRALTFQYFSLMDDIEFDFNGAPITNYGQLPRETLYTWAYMLRPPPWQPGPGIPPRAVECSVVVYNRRAAVPGIARPPEHYYGGVTFNSIDNSIILRGGPRQGVKVQKGNWVLDVTRVPPFGFAPYNVPHAYFYRVNSVVANPNGPTYLKVDQPLRGFDNVGGKWSLGNLVIMDNVVEVFEKSTLE